MPIARRVEYIRVCDVPNCCTAEAADWSTREAAEAEATRDGWKKITRGRWICPRCVAAAEARIAARLKGTATQ